jgi:hypothetical protein
MPAARGWANAAILVGLVVSPIIVCIGLFQSAAVGLASSGGDCAGGCSKRHQEQAAAAERLIYGGLIGGAVLVIGGMAGRHATRRSRPEHEGEDAPELPRARVTGSSRRLS